MIALSEPQGAPSWFPANDYPTDKATYSIAMTVPNNLSAISNGRLVGKETRDGKTKWKWNAEQPMASYLTTMAIGAFEVTTGTTTQGLPFVNAIEPALAADSAAAIARTSEIIDWEASLFGKYPFDAVGVIAVDAPDVGYALETQTRTGFTTAVDESTYVHELAHQWVGDSLSLTSFPEMWLNEGFAQYTEKLWAEREGMQTTQAWFDETYATPAADELWTDAPAALPGPQVLFSRPVYDRGAMTLHQLRVRVGDDKFFKTWLYTPGSPPYRSRSRRDLAAELPDHIVDAGREGFDVGWIDGGEHADADLVAAEFAVAVGVDHAVGTQRGADVIGLHSVEVDRSHDA